MLSRTSNILQVAHWSILFEERIPVTREPRTTLLKTHWKGCVEEADSNQLVKLDWHWAAPDDTYVVLVRFK